MRVCVVRFAVEVPFTPDEPYGMVPLSEEAGFLHARATLFRKMTEAVPDVVNLGCWDHNCLLPPPDIVLDRHLQERVEKRGYAFTEIDNSAVWQAANLPDGTVEFFLAYSHLAVSRRNKPAVHVRWSGTPAGSTRRHSSAAVPLQAWLAQMDIRDMPFRMLVRPTQTPAENR